MNLPQLLRTEQPAILTEWKSVLRSQATTEEVRGERPSELLPPLLASIAELLEKTAAGSSPRACEIEARQHALSRVAQGASLRDVMQEYGALRQAILLVWQRSGDFDVQNRTAFHTILDLTIGAAADHYGRAHDSEARKRNELQYQALLEYAEDMVLILGEDGTLLYQSPSTERTLGYPPHDALYRSGFDFVHPEDRSAAAQHLVRIMETGTPQRMELRVRRKDGVWRYLDAVAARFPEGAAVRGLIITAHDITESKQAIDERTAELNALLSSAHAFVRDLDGRIVAWTPGASALYGWSSEEAIGRISHDLLHTESPIPLADIERIVVTTGQWEGELVHVRRDGVRIVVASHWTLRRNPRGAPVAFVEVNNDITALKQAEQALKDMDRRKDEFLAMLAHELRNPLVPIRNGMHILQAMGPLEPRFVRTREMIERQLKHMARMLDDLLDASRITRGVITLQRQPVEISRILLDAVESLRSTIESGGHELSVAVPHLADCHVDADPARLAQVFSNLLSNAAKFTPPGGRIALSLECDGRQAVVRVADTGVGIKPEILPQIFDLFVQDLPAPDRQPGGLGIGLTLVKRIIELHGGTVRALSAGPGRGSEFVITLPTQAVPPPAELPAPARAGGTGRPLRILIVEDNPDVAASFALVLEMFGHQVRVTEDAPRALAAANEFAADVAFIDIGLPGMNGYELAERLRAGSPLQHAALIAISGYGRGEDKRRASAAGFDAHLTKPAEPDKVAALLDQIGSGPARQADGRVPP